MSKASQQIKLLECTKKNSKSQAYPRNLFHLESSTVSHLPIIFVTLPLFVKFT